MNDEQTKMNLDRERLLRLAESEDGGPIGVGGLLSRETAQWLRDDRTQLDEVIRRHFGIGVDQLVRILGCAERIAVEHRVYTVLDGGVGVRIPASLLTEFLAAMGKTGKPL